LKQIREKWRIADMRKVISTLAVVAVVAMLLAPLGLSAAQDKPTQTWTGWISDSGCGAKGMSAGHRDCAIKCVKEKGAKWVFVNSENKAVLAIHNQDAVNPETDLGGQVKVTGHVTEDGSLHVDSIAPAK
jgi:hypothetical protein